MAIPYLEKFKNVTYQYETEHDSFIGRGLQLNMMVDKINTIAEFVNDNIIESGGSVNLDTITVNTINEYTTDNGVNVEGVHFENGEMSLDYLGNPTQNNTISFGAHTLTWQFTNPNGGLEYNWIGAASGHLFTLSQQTGVPSAGTHLLHMDADSTNVVFLHMQHAVAGTRVWYTSVDGDSVGVGRYQVNTNGKMDWGSGSSAVDVSLERSSVSTLAITGSLTVSGTVTPTSYTNFDGRYYTESEVDGLFTTHSSSSDHDGRYYTETELSTSGQSSVHYDNITNIPSDHVKMIHVQFDYLDTTPVIVGTIPAGSFIYNIEVHVTTVFNDTTANTLQIGYTGSTSYYLNTDDSILTNIGYWTILNETTSLNNIPETPGADREIVVSYQPFGDATAGEAVLYVFYV